MDGIEWLSAQRMRLNCCNENLNKLKTNKCSAEEKMDYDKIKEGDKVKFTQEVLMEGEIFKVCQSYKDPTKRMIVINATSCKIVDAKNTAYGVFEI
jgi:ASC-1-like (ASCH) protein